MFGNSKEPYLNVSFIDLRKRGISDNFGSLAGSSLKDITMRNDTTDKPPFDQESLLDRLRRYLRSTNIKPVEVLQEFDKTKSGFLTNV